LCRNDTAKFLFYDIYSMKYRHSRLKYCFWAIALLFLSSSFLPNPVQKEPDWGFFAHKRINRLAVLTLPPEMMVFFKKHIDYVTEHAVDPDMRRYATKHEGIRHFIDLDNYGAAPFDTLPRAWLDALAAFTEIMVIDEKGDTLPMYGPKAKFRPKRDWPTPMRNAYRELIYKQVLPFVFEESREMNPDSLLAFANGFDFGALESRKDQINIKKAFFTENFTEHGVLPWNLQQFQRRLTEAFRAKDARNILRLSAEMGHYLGDAHVPLHTTSNYNGQKTGQHGIHGFWESRIPELFADETYDYFVGKPEYIDNTASWFWETVLVSNSMVDSVLDMERALRINFPPDRQMCPDMRLGIMIMAPCRDYAAAYQRILNGMVERRMRQTIHAVSSAWYTAWVDAGQPDLKNIELPPPGKAEEEEELALKKKFEQGKIQGRAEDH
jgi:hypothetical protein